MGLLKNKHFEGSCELLRFKSELNCLLSLTGAQEKLCLSVRLLDHLFMQLFIHLYTGQTLQVKSTYRGRTLPLPVRECTWTDITHERNVHGRTLHVRGMYMGQTLQVRVS